MQKYNKAIAAVLSFGVLILNKELGYDPGWDEATYMSIAGLISSVFVYLVPNI